MSAPTPVVSGIAEIVRSLDEEGLARLLELRPDVLVPVPRNLGEVIERLGTHGSTEYALERLDAWQLRVLTAVAARIPEAELADALGGTDADVDAALTTLRELALISGQPATAIPIVGSVLGPWPAGLAEPSPIPLEQAALAPLIAALGPQERAVLDRLAWGPPTGQVRNAQRHVDPATASSPIDRLLAGGLLRPLDANTVALPREVALFLRDGRYFADAVSPIKPAWQPAPANALGHDLGPELIDRASIGSAQEFVSHVALLSDLLDELLPAPLASGAMSKKDTTTIARRIGHDEVARFAVELAAHCGLLARGAAWLPTTRMDEWLAADAFHRWLTLVAGWTSLPAMPDAEHPNALDPATRQAWVPVLRAMVANELRSLAAGAALNPADLARRVEWEHPGWRNLDLAAACAMILDEASWLGLIAFNRTSSLANVDESTSDPGFTPYAREIVIQSDLTIVAPAPLDRDAATQIAQMAELESHGATGVYRLSHDSVRRALDAGWTADSVRAWLTDHATTGVPAVVDQLIDDVARKHGRIRVTAISSVVQIDDEDVLVALLQHHDAADLGLQRLGPGVLGASAEADEVVELLRELGYSPMASDSQGVRFTPPAARLNPPATAPRAAVPEARDVAERLLSMGVPTDPGHLLDLLNDAMVAKRPVTVVYASDDGATRTVNAQVTSVVHGAATIVDATGDRIIVPVRRVVTIQPS